MIEEILSGDRAIVVIDVEATCWKKGVFSKRKETIELGAVRFLRGRASAEWPEFQTFVKPLKLPRLSSFCRELTGITQEDVDAAPLFPAALYRFLEWAQPLEHTVLASWSHYDIWQLELDLQLHELPKLPLTHLDIKKLATRVLGGMSISDTAHALGVDFGEGRHRALTDARKTAEILDKLLAPR